MSFRGKLSFHRDLRLQLLAVYLLFFGVVSFGTYWFERDSNLKLRADVDAADVALAQAVAQETTIVVQNAVEAVSDIAQLPGVLEANPIGMEKIFSTVLLARPDVNLAYRLGADGVNIFHYPIGPGSTVGMDFSYRDYFQKALVTNEAFLSKGRISPTTQEPVATAVMPLWDDGGNFMGVVATNIKLQFLSNGLSSIGAERVSGQQLDIIIIDADGQIIANRDPEKLLTDARRFSPEVVEDVLSGESGSLIGRDVQGREVLYSYVPVTTSGWGVMVIHPTSLAFATLNAFRRGRIIAIGLFILGGIIFWWTLSRKLFEPLENLALFSQEIGSKHRPTEEQLITLSAQSGRSDQVGHLAASLSWMYQSIEARLAELSTLLDTSAAVVSILDPQVVLDKILDQVSSLLGTNMCAIVALDEQRNIFRYQTSRGLAPRYTERAVIDPADPRSVTMQAINSGGAVQISDTETDPSYTVFRAHSQLAGYRSVLAVPLKTHNAPPSALLVFRPTPHVFTDRETDLMTNFANHAAMAIENAVLYSKSDMRLQEQTRRLEALVQSMHDGLILEDLTGKVQYANRRISELSNIPLGEIPGVQFENLVKTILSQAINKETVEKSIASLLSQNEEDNQAEISIMIQNRVRHIRLRLFDVSDNYALSIGRGLIIQDVTERRELDRMKSSLISTVSHELRTPLAAIKGYASTLLADDVAWDAASQHEFLEIISQEVDHLSDLVSDLLDMSRIEAGNLRVTMSSCDLRDIVQKAAARAHPEPGSRLMVRIPEDFPKIIVDSKRIETVLRNLLENAAKYSDDNTPIYLEAQCHPNEIIVYVKDQGPGIPEEFSDRIFESFYRIEGGLTRNRTGAGLGLAISQGFIQAHQGKMWLEQGWPGACFGFSLPQFSSPNL